MMFPVFWTNKGGCRRGGVGGQQKTNPSFKLCIEGYLSRIDRGPASPWKLTNCKYVKKGTIQDDIDRIQTNKSWTLGMRAANVRGGLSWIYEPLRWRGKCACSIILCRIVFVFFKTLRRRGNKLGWGLPGDTCGLPESPALGKSQMGGSQAEFE